MAMEKVVAAVLALVVAAPLVARVVVQEQAMDASKRNNILPDLWRGIVGKDALAAGVESPVAIASVPQSQMKLSEAISAAKVDAKAMFPAALESKEAMDASTRNILPDLRRGIGGKDALAASVESPFAIASVPQPKVMGSEAISTVKADAQAVYAAALKPKDAVNDVQVSGFPQDESVVAYDAPGQLQSNPFLKALTSVVDVLSSIARISFGVAPDTSPRIARNPSLIESILSSFKAPPVPGRVAEAQQMIELSKVPGQQPTLNSAVEVAAVGGQAGLQSSVATASVPQPQFMVNEAISAAKVDAQAMYPAALNSKDAVNSAQVSSFLAVQPKSVQDESLVAYDATRQPLIVKWLSSVVGVLNRITEIFVGQKDTARIANPSFIESILSSFKARQTIELSKVPDQPMINSAVEVAAVDPDTTIQSKTWLGMLREGLGRLA